MPSAIGWLDYSSKQQTQMREIISLLADSDSRDELGIASIRDAFSDLLFPGVSTIQTRSRYFLFIPWIYQELERKRTSPNDFAKRSRKLQTELIDALVAGGETQGIIGIEARENLKRLPDSVYWAGLNQFNIRQFDGNIALYGRSLSRFHKRRVTASDFETGEDDDGATNWDRGLPSAPDDFLTSTSFALRPEDAEYLKERMISTSRSSLLAAFLRDGGELEETAFAWDSLPAAGQETMDLVHLARFFSEMIWGAALLYNLMLAQQRVVKGSHPGDGQLVAHYTELIDDYAQLLGARKQAHDAVDMIEFWATLERANARVPQMTRQFVNNWITLVRNDGPAVADNPAARLLVGEHEQRHKRSLSRFAHDRQLELWSGAAGTGRMTYRWGIAQSMVTDIAQGMANA